MTKEYEGLTREQVLGLEPITQEEFRKATLKSEQDFDEGRYTIVPKTYAEFRKVILGLNDEKLSGRHFERSRARA